MPQRQNCNYLLIYRFTRKIAPENWQELRSKPELHSSELTGLHLADWVSRLSKFGFVQN